MYTLCCTDFKMDKYSDLYSKKALSTVYVLSPWILLEQYRCWGLGWGMVRGVVFISRQAAAAEDVVCNYYDSTKPSIHFPTSCFIRSCSLSTKTFSTACSVNSTSLASNSCSSTKMNKISFLKKIMGI